MSLQRNFLLKIGALEIDLVRVDPLLKQPGPFCLRQIRRFHPFDLEMRLGSKDAPAEINKHPVFHGFVV